MDSCSEEQELDKVRKNEKELYSQENQQGLAIVNFANDALLGLLFNQTEDSLSYMFHKSFIKLPKKV
jgi:hypothetical protein